jgi:hypothetical protein
MSRIKKIRDVHRLDEDDLDLINEARGLTREEQEAEIQAAKEEAARKAAIRAQNEAELRKGLFYDSDEDAAAAAAAPRRPAPKQTVVERYDEDGMVSRTRTC